MLMVNTLVDAKEKKMRKRRMEKDQVAMCCLDEEGTSGNTTMQRHADSKKQKESTDELILPHLHNIHAKQVQSCQRECLHG